MLVFVTRSLEWDICLVCFPYPTALSSFQLLKYNLEPSSKAILYWIQPYPEGSQTLFSIMKFSDKDKIFV